MYYYVLWMIFLKSRGQFFRVYSDGGSNFHFYLIIAFKVPLFLLAFKIENPGLICIAFLI